MNRKPTPESTVANRLDALPVTALHIGVMLVCGLGLTFDLLEIALGSALSAVFSQAPHQFAPSQLSWLLSAVFVGAIVGTPVLGWFADRFGRRATLAGMLVWLGTMSMGAAFSTHFAALIAFRVLAGMALGAYPPTVIAFLTDLLPPGRRGMLLFCVVALSTLGPIGAIFLVRWLTPLQPLGLEAWRWGFIVGSAGVLLAGLSFRLLPESPRWLERRGATARALAALLRFERSRRVAGGGVTLVQVSNVSNDGDARPTPTAPGELAPRGWHLVFGVFFLSPWATAAFPLMTGAILAQKGVRLSDALLYIGLSLFGPMLGSLLAAALLDRFERRLALMVTGAGMLAFGLVFILSSSPFWLVASNLAFSTVGLVYISALNVYASELFPTSVRASRVANAWALNRLGAALGTVVLLPLMHATGPLAMFSVVAASLALSIALLYRAPAGLARKAVR